MTATTCQRDCGGADCGESCDLRDCEPETVTESGEDVAAMIEERRRSKAGPGPCGARTYLAAYGGRLGGRPLYELASADWRA